MRQFQRLIAQGKGLAATLLQRTPTIALDWDQRQKSRFDAHTEDAEHIGVVLPRGTVLRGGDVLLATDGSLLRVIAAPQSLLRITPQSAHALLRAAYHLGNRHVAVELCASHLQIEADHVLAEMLRAMQLKVEECQAPFEPEHGAYAGHASAHHHPHTH